jgi:hypothetical protein
MKINRKMIDLAEPRSSLQLCTAVEPLWNNQSEVAIELQKGRAKKT